MSSVSSSKYNVTHIKEINEIIKSYVPDWTEFVRRLAKYDAENSKIKKIFKDILENYEYHESLDILFHLMNEHKAYYEMQTWLRKNSIDKKDYLYMNKNRCSYIPYFLIEPNQQDIQKIIFGHELEEQQKIIDLIKTTKFTFKYVEEYKKTSNSRLYKEYDSFSYIEHILAFALIVMYKKDTGQKKLKWSSVIEVV